MEKFSLLTKKQTEVIYLQTDYTDQTTKRTCPSLFLPTVREGTFAQDVPAKIERLGISRSFRIPTPELVLILLRGCDGPFVKQIPFKRWRIN